MKKKVTVLKSLKELSERPDFLNQLKELGILPDKKEIQVTKRPRRTVVPDFKGGNKIVEVNPNNKMRKIFIIVSCGMPQQANQHHSTELQKRALQPGFKVESSSCTHTISDNFVTAVTLFTIVTVDYTHASQFWNFIHHVFKPSI